MKDFFFYVYLYRTILCLIHTRTQPPQGLPRHHARQHSTSLTHYVTTTTTMGATNLIPLVILFAVVGGLGWVGYQVTQLLCSLRIVSLTCVSQIFLYSNELAERGVKKMEKKNVVFTKDGAKVGVKEVSNETYADKTQRAFVKTWNAAHDGWVVDD